MQYVNETAATDRDATDDTAVRRLLVFIIRTCDGHLSHSQHWVTGSLKLWLQRLIWACWWQQIRWWQSNCSEMEWLSPPALTRRKSPPAAGWAQCNYRRSNGACPDWQHQSFSSCCHVVVFLSISIYIGENNWQHRELRLTNAIPLCTGITSHQLVHRYCCHLSQIVLHHEASVEYKNSECAAL